MFDLNGNVHIKFNITNRSEWNIETFLAANIHKQQVGKAFTEGRSDV